MQTEILKPNKNQGPSEANSQKPSETKAKSQESKAESQEPSEAKAKSQVKPSEAKAKIQKPSGYANWRS